MSHRRPEAIDALVSALSRLPSIGTVTAERLAYHLLAVPEDEAFALADAIRRVRDEVRVCRVCSNVDANDPCRICEDETRDHTRVLVVEGPRDLASFEAAGWKGVYHVLRGRIAPLEGVRGKDLTIAALLARARRPGFAEVCLATNPDLEGERTAQEIADVLLGLENRPRITRIARGIPAGAGITQVQHTILADALEGRRELR
ncbi:MAG: recombination protein RecR [Planctomycetes bacterium]|nr:recombination protein RecR [Planctomycetota bacterium]